LFGQHEVFPEPIAAGDELSAGTGGLFTPRRGKEIKRIAVGRDRDMNRRVMNSAA